MSRYLLMVLLMMLSVVCGTFLAPYVPWGGSKTLVLSPLSTTSLEELVDFYETWENSQGSIPEVMLSMKVSSAQANPALVAELRDRLRLLQSQQAEANTLIRLAGWFTDEPPHLLVEALKERLDGLDDSLQREILISLRKMHAFPKPEELLPLMSSSDIQLRELVAMWTRIEHGSAGRDIFVKCLEDNSPEVRAEGFCSCRATGVDVRSLAKARLHSILQGADVKTSDTMLFECPRELRECIRYIENAYGVVPPSRYQYQRLGSYANAILVYVESVDAARAKAQQIFVRETE